MATASAIRSFTLDVDELGWTGYDLRRPESVVAEADGTLCASDGRGGVMRIALGRVQRMTRDGLAATVLEEVDGQRTTSAPVPGLPMRHWS